MNLLYHFSWCTALDSVQLNISQLQRNSSDLNLPSLMLIILILKSNVAQISFPTFTNICELCTPIWVQYTLLKFALKKIYFGEYRILLHFQNVPNREMMWLWGVTFHLTPEIHNCWRRVWRSKVRAVKKFKGSNMRANLEKILLLVQVLSGDDTLYENESRNRVPLKAEDFGWQ